MTPWSATRECRTGTWSTCLVKNAEPVNSKSFFEAKISKMARSSPLDFHPVSNKEKPPPSSVHVSGASTSASRCHRCQRPVGLRGIPFHDRPVELRGDFVELPKIRVPNFFFGYVLGHGNLRTDLRLFALKQLMQNTKDQNHWRTSLRSLQPTGGASSLATMMSGICFLMATPERSSQLMPYSFAFVARCVFRIKGSTSSPQKEDVYHDNPSFACVCSRLPGVMLRWHTFETSLATNGEKNHRTSLDCFG